MGKFLVHTKHVADLAATHADVASGHILVRAYVAIQFQHESLAEAHHLSVALATGREVGTALATAHGQGGKRIFESLLKGEELEDRGIDGGMKTDAALVRADGVVMLDAVAHISLHVALVINPVNTELQDTVGYTQSLDEVRPVKFRVLIVLIFCGCQHLAYCLDILRLIWKSSLQTFHNICSFHLAVCFNKMVNRCDYTFNLYRK